MKIMNLLSGGLDSTTMLFKHKLGAHNEAIFFDYGQRHIKEQLAAEKICRDLGVKLHQGKLAEMFLPHSRFSAVPITSQHGDTDIIVNRNANLVISAATFALKNGMDAVSIGCNADDAKGFPDCTQGFLDAMRQVLKLCHTRPVELLTPFIDMTKVEVAVLALELGVPIDETWSCYEGGKEPCGACSACLLREEALGRAPH